MELVTYIYNKQYGVDISNMKNEIITKIIEVYTELKVLIEDMYSGEKNKHIYTYDIEKAIFELGSHPDTFDESELDLEYKNIKALRDFQVKRKMLGDDKSFRFYLRKQYGITRTSVIIDKKPNDIKHIIIKIPNNIDMIYLDRHLTSLVDFDGNVTIDLYIKSLSQIHQNHLIILETLRYEKLRIYEDGALIKI